MKKSWYLEDAEEIAQEFKYTFYKPSQRVINKLKPGNFCKLIFIFESTNPEHPRAERMWVIVETISNGKFTGKLDNSPFYIQDLVIGDIIHFEPKHIIGTSLKDEKSDVTEKYLNRCFATKRIIYDKQKIGYFYREEPMEGEINGYKDSGWRFLEGDENPEYINDADNSQFVSLGLILNIDDSFIELLQEPIGEVFVRSDGTDQFVRLDRKHPF